MKRRTLLRTGGAGIVGAVSGCLGGGEVVVSVNESVSIRAHSAWVKELPDVSDPGGAIKFVIRSSDKPFDVYLFANETEYEYYDAYLNDEDPPETPAGVDRFSKAAVPTSASAETYEVATRDEGARESLDVTGPSYFVVDHSNYRMRNRVDEHADPLSVFVNLTVIQNKFGF